MHVRSPRRSGVAAFLRLLSIRKALSASGVLRRPSLSCSHSAARALSPLSTAATHFPVPQSTKCAVSNLDKSP